MACPWLFFDRHELALRAPSYYSFWFLVCMHGMPIFVLSTATSSHGKPFFRKSVSQSVTCTADTLDPEGSTPRLLEIWISQSVSQSPALQTPWTQRGPLLASSKSGLTELTAAIKSQDSEGFQKLRRFVAGQLTWEEASQTTRTLDPEGSTPHLLLLCHLPSTERLQRDQSPYATIAITTNRLPSNLPRILYLPGTA